MDKFRILELNHYKAVELWCWERVDCEQNLYFLEGQTAALYTRICQELRHT
jgi:hypothetical protein